MYFCGNNGERGKAAGLECRMIKAKALITKKAARESGEEGLREEGEEKEGGMQRWDERAKALSTKNSTRRMKAGRTGAEAQRRRQN